MTEHATFVSGPKIKLIFQISKWESSPLSPATAPLRPQQLQSLSVPRTDVPKTRPATTTDAGDKGRQNFTSSADISGMEYDYNLKT